MGFADMMKICFEGENNGFSPALEQLRMERMMQEHEKSIDMYIAAKLLSKINADLERITSEMKNEAP